MFLKAIDKRDRELAVHNILLGDHNQPELIVHTAFDSMASETKVHILLSTKVNIVLQRREKISRASVTHLLLPKTHFSKMPDLLLPTGPHIIWFSWSKFKSLFCVLYLHETNTILKC